MTTPLDIDRYARIVVLTGAGISAGSGLRTYRGPGGVWEEHDVALMGHVTALHNHPADTWRLFGGMRVPVLQARPNAAHRALALLEARLQPHQQMLLVTQNVDGLHQAAGSRNVCEIHGHLMHTRCSNAACDLPRFRDEATHQNAVPHCPRCGSVLRPDVVLFGEELPLEATWAVKRALRDCDLFLAVGTSGLVEPAASYVRSAQYAGARTLLLNLEPLARPNPAFQEQLLGRAEDLLPRLLGVADA